MTPWIRLHANCHLQVVAKQVQYDDVLINELLDKSQKLQEVTNNIIESLNRTDKKDRLDIKTLFLTDMCASLAATMNETMTVMYDKACRVEIPVLNEIDTLVAQLCGYYCLKDSCDYGFPSLILTEYKLCLTDEERQGKEGSISSNAYVQVHKFITASKRSYGKVMSSHVSVCSRGRVYLPTMPWGR